MKNMLLLNRLVLALLASGLLLFTACESDDDDDEPAPDTTAPAIADVSPAPDSDEHSFARGAQMTLQATITDDQGLSQVKVEVHNVFDGHSHDKVQDYTPWEMDTIISLNGETSYTLNQTMEVPAMATAGKYHVILRALDQNGNEAAFVEVTFVVEGGPSIAHIDLMKNGQAMNDMHFHFDGADNLDLNVQSTIEAQESDELEEVHLMIMEAHGHDDHDGHGHDKVGEGDHGDPIYEAEWEHSDLGGSGTYDLDHTFDVAKSAFEDDAHYYVVIKAVDHDGNRSEKKRELHVMH